MANRSEVATKLRELIGRLDQSEEGARSLSTAFPDTRVVAVHVTDLGAEYWTELRDGRLGKLNEGPPDEAHIRIRASSEDLVELIDGEAGGLFGAYLAGRLRIDASLSDLLRLRKLL